MIKNNPLAECHDDIRNVDMTNNPPIDNCLMGQINSTKFKIQKCPLLVPVSIKYILSPPLLKWSRERKR